MGRRERIKANRSRYVPIYILRSTCDTCGIDTARTFVLKGGENPTQAFEQMEAHVIKLWPQKHPLCTHRIAFHWITDQEYKWDLKCKEAVLR